MKLTRRKLAAAMVAAGGAVARPQAPPPADELKAKRDLMHANAAAVADFSIPMATEPSFQFKA
ncbi:MAG TPA: hypothetical protein VMH28_26215 [Candidatus Acidoferrales bacterium]|nr:hypothetical protein [Candidatus Acidoferrales bacterium]